MVISQVALLICGVLLAAAGSEPRTIAIVGAIAFAVAMASATQDIAYDAYTVDVLRRDEQGAAAGLRTAAYRAAMAVSGGLSITLAATFGWSLVNLLMALLYVPMLVLTWKAPEPQQVPPPRTLRDAVWLPFVELLSRRRALEILAFVVLYKFADQLAQALTRPFLIDMGYDAYHRGIALATVGLVGTMSGALIGGWITVMIGLGHALWFFGGLQIFSNLGYFFLARAEGQNLPLMYAATSFELFTSGLGTGAFSVLLLRLTEKRFSATQYALFSSLFALPRLAAGPITGFAVYAIGWETFYLATMVIGIPGLLMLARFVPLGVRDPQFTTDGRAADDRVADEGPLLAPAAISTAQLVQRGLLGAVVCGGAALAIVVGLAALQTWSTANRSFDVGAVLGPIFRPASVTDWVQVAGILAVAAIGGLFTAAASVSSRRRR
jgi:PAT family beta-lactamase induction signal transducer AmpG